VRPFKDGEAFIGTTVRIYKVPKVSWTVGRSNDRLLLDLWERLPAANFSRSSNFQETQVQTINKFGIIMMNKLSILQHLFENICKKIEIF